jgi:hypothetical protein
MMMMMMIDVFYTLWQVSSRAEAIKHRDKKIFINAVTQNALENDPSLIAFSSLVTSYWIDETASNLVPFITVLI